MQQIENKRMNKIIAMSLLAISLIACNSANKPTASAHPEDLVAKKLLQGIWLDDETETPLMHIKGDTIYYTDNQSIPVYFNISKDTLYMHGNEIARYRIDRQTEFSFWFHSFSDNLVKLHKSEDLNDTLAFARDPADMIQTYTEVTQRDSIVMYNGIRYRAYIYINPSKIKVTKTSYTEEGIGMDNVYYDNVMHICVYQGKKSLYASDITKQMFSHVIPTEFLNQSILSDMNFIGIDQRGYHYQAMICIPQSYVCYVANLAISFDGELKITAAK